MCAIVDESRHALRLNVGFIVGLPVGSSREFLFDFPSLHLPPDLDLSQLSGSARVTRTPQGLYLQVKMQAVVQTECVRCLDGIQLPLRVDFADLFAFTSRTVSESGLILPEDGYIDLAPMVREYMLLEIPINPLCTPDCKGLCAICGENLNESPHNHNEEVIDPRLAILKNLLK